MKRFYIPLLLFLLAACQPVPSATITPSPTPTQTATTTLISTASPLPTHTPTSIPSPTATPTPPPNQRPRYHLAAAFDYTAQSLTVQEQITYTNRADVSLAELVLVVEPIRWLGAFTLTSLAWGDGETAGAYAMLPYSWDVQRMIVTLPQPLASGETIFLSLAYTLTIPPIPTDADRPVPFGFTARQTNLVDWYAYISPYQGGWLVNNPGYFGEHEVSESADFVVDVTLVNPPSGLVLAASAPASPIASGYHYEMQAARSFALSASLQYQVASSIATLTDGRAITVTHYGSPFVASMAPQVISDTVRAVELFSELFAPYPHDQLSVVQADFLDGMEYDGLFFLSNGFYNTYAGLPDDYLTAIAVHETAHQWWYALIGNDQGQEPWLDEALSMYSEVLYYECVYPAALPAWWARRVDFYQPEGLIGLSIYDYPGFVPYRNAVYLRGALFLRDLRSQMGDEAFFAFLTDYAVRQSRQITTTDDFFTILAEHTDAGIHDLKQEYFGR